MKKETILLIAIALIVGLLVGLLVAKQGSKSGRQVAAPSAAPAVNFQEKIRFLEELAGREPGNRNAWVELGHLYFDTDQPVKAIEAYDKALQLDPNDPDVLTDQGVMFRRMGWYDRAIDNFTKAHAIKPTHQQSIYNLGVVYRYDLQDFPRAIEAWNKFLAVSPAGPGADQVRRELEAMRNLPGASPAR